MSQPILVTGAAGGRQGSTGNRVAQLLVQHGLNVRALVHHVDERSERLRKLGAEVIPGDLLDPALVRKALQDVKRAYFTYPVDDGLLEATAIFAMAARESSTEMVVNMSQLQNTAVAPSFRNLQHRLADQTFDWADVGAVHLNAPPFFENVRTLIAKTVSDQNTIFLPWGDGGAVFPLVAAEDCARVAAALPSLWRFFRTSGIRKGDGGFRRSKAIELLTGAAPQTLEQFFRINLESFAGSRPSA
jgi:uncharacterized protein YbjT (DUF2867 family)